MSALCLRTLVPLPLTLAPSPGSSRKGDSTKPAGLPGCQQPGWEREPQRFMATHAPAPCRGLVYLLTDGTPAEREVILSGAGSSDRGNHHCLRVRTGQGTEGTQADARGRGTLKALGKQMVPRQGLRVAEGGTTWQPSLWTGFSRVPVGS